MSTPQFRRATRQAVKLKVLAMGPSGSGKTMGALRIAESITPKIALIDSENDRSGYYADSIEFDSLSLHDHTPNGYMEAIQAAIEAGYEIVIIDSLSHAWLNVLDRKEAYDRANPRSNSYTNWKLFGAEWERLIRFILDAPIHVIATARSKQAYELVEDNGKKRPEKMGLAPQIREGTEYEFALVFDLFPSHMARVTKDNTGRFDRGEAVLWNLCDGSVGAELRDWLQTAKPVARPTPATCAAIDDAIRALPENKQVAARQRWAARRDKGVTEEEAQQILAALRPATSPAETTAGEPDATSQAEPDQPAEDQAEPAAETETDPAEAALSEDTRSSLEESILTLERHDERQGRQWRRAYDQQRESLTEAKGQELVSRLRPLVQAAVEAARSEAEADDAE